jgi:hypothetical protein
LKGFVPFLFGTGLITRNSRECPLRTNKMAHLILNPTCNALMERLREADRQRDHLRAQLADAAMVAELEQVDRNLPWGLTGEKRAEVKAEREAAIQERIAKRATRRANEMRIFGSYTRPGTWDADLDNYQEPRYEEDVEGGYRIRLVRARDLTWNAYVVLPEFHPAAGRHYDFFGGYESPAGLPFPPQHLTYNAVEDGRGVYGFYLTGAVKPREDYGDYTAHNFYSVEKTGYSPFADNGSVHVDYAQMRQWCVELVDYFKGLATDLGHATICRSATKCADHGFYVGVCVGCVPPSAPRAEPSLASRATLPRAPHAEPSLASRATLPKKSWAAVAAVK